MTDIKTAYDELSSPQEMWADCQAADRLLHLPLQRVAADAVRPAPSLRFEDHPQGLPKREIEMLAAAEHLARALGLDQD